MKCPACGIPIRSVHPAGTIRGGDFHGKVWAYYRMQAHPCGDYLDIPQVQEILRGHGLDVLLGGDVDG